MIDENAAHILVVDDDNRLRELLRRFLSENGFLVSTAIDAKEARARLESLMFDIIVLDLMMPGESGLDFAADLRTRSDVPILMLTAMGEAEDRITGLEHGADDYLTKPFEPRELLLRINSILRRVNHTREPEQRTLQLGAFIFDTERSELTHNGVTVRLTSVETALLAALADNQGEPLSREDLIESTGATGGGRAVDVQVTRLRRKIEPDHKMPRYI